MTQAQRKDLETMSVFIDRLLAFGNVYPTVEQQRSVETGCVFLTAFVADKQNKVRKGIDNQSPNRL